MGQAGRRGDRRPLPRSHENVEIELVVLHHDLESFGGNTDYMVPAKLIMERFPNCQKIVTGHWHLEGDYVIDGVPVACTGSLEPYTHAEDPDGELYVSLTLEQLEARDPAELGQMRPRLPPRR
jgi:predicted phosphodiesterase